MFFMPWLEIQSGRKFYPAGTYLAIYNSRAKRPFFPPGTNLQFSREFSYMAYLLQYAKSEPRISDPHKRIAREELPSCNTIKSKGASNERNAAKRKGFLLSRSDIAARHKR